MASNPDQAAQVSLGEIDRIVAGTHYDPHSVLGAHPGPDGGVIVRALRPLAKSVAVVLPDGTRFPMDHVHEGVFAVVLPAGEVPDYRLAVSYPGPGGAAMPETLVDDPYRHLPTLGEVDLYLIGEGRHEQLWQVLGAHVHRPGPAGQPAAAGFEPLVGTSFAVWAPNARGVRLIGDFNHWDGRGHPMRSLGGAGVWEIYVPGSRRGRQVQVRHLRAGRAVAAQGRPHGQPGRAPAGHRVRRVQLGACVGRRGLAGGARAGRAGPRAGQHLRGAPRILAPGPVLRRTRRGTDRLRGRAGLHPRGVPAGRRASVRRLLGLPGDLVLRADVTVRDAG